MAKGNIAKENFISELKTFLGDRFVGIQDKKVYFWGEEDGEKLQLCMALTCPKTPIGNVPEVNTGGAFGSMEVPEAVNIEITEAEKENIRKLRAQFGI